MITFAGGANAARYANGKPWRHLPSPRHPKPAARSSLRVNISFIHSPVKREIRSCERGSVRIIRHQSPQLDVRHMHTHSDEVEDKVKRKIDTRNFRLKIIAVVENCFGNKYHVEAVDSRQV